MIEDEFDRMFREIVERFFGNSFGLGDNGVFQIRVHATNTPEMESNQVRPRVREERKASVEKIELGDKMLVIIDGFAYQKAPSVLVKGKKMRILSEEEEGKEITVELPFEVDIERSTGSFRNGTIEVELFKTENSKTDDEYRSIKMI